MKKIKMKVLRFMLRINIIRFRTFYKYNKNTILNDLNY